MGGCGGKSPAQKSNSYTPKKMSSTASKPSSSRGGLRSAGTSNFGTPKVRMSFGGRSR